MVDTKKFLQRLQPLLHGLHSPYGEVERSDWYESCYDEGSGEGSDEDSVADSDEGEGSDWDAGSNGVEGWLVSSVCWGSLLCTRISKIVGLP